MSFMILLYVMQLALNLSPSCTCTCRPTFVYVSSMLGTHKLSISINVCHFRSLLVANFTSVLRKMLESLEKSVSSS